MFCKNCGAKIENDAKFCGSCGKPVGESSSIKAAPEQENNIIKNPFPHGAPIGGWLIVVGFALTLEILEFGSYLTQAADSQFQFIYLAQLLLTAYLVYLFFRRKKQFPKYWIALLMSVVLVTFVNGVRTDWSNSEILLSLVSTLLWIWYAFVSKRVKATFIN
jgi:drug/metabolite transporter (DMT)-like permease